MGANLSIRRIAGLFCVDRPLRHAASVGSCVAQRERQTPYKSVAVLKKNAPFHLWHQLAIGKGPIRNREARVIAGDEAARDHKKQRADRHDDCVAV